MKLLLHTCCAPCLIYPLERLRENNLQVTGFFYNPNIHGFMEYKNRRQAVFLFAQTRHIEIIYPQYNPYEFFQAVNFSKDKSTRCNLCWLLRLKQTAQLAKQKGFVYFSTTLLVSPYQSQEALKKIGDDVSRQTGVKFYYEDFRPGFKKAHNQARAEGLYCQKYCGCIYSEVERYKKL
jgi:predicted adenine nucleotide alpha hydrolase (AANH) superfamily ATPase